MESQAFLERILAAKVALDAAYSDAGVRRRLSLYGWCRAAELELERALESAVSAASYGGSFSDRVSLEIARRDFEAKKVGMLPADVRAELVRIEMGFVVPFN